MIALHGAYYNNNFGDLLLIKIFERWLREAGVDEIVFPMVDPSERTQFEKEFPAAKYGLDSVAQWNGLVYAGGGYFGEPQSNRRHWFGGDWNARFCQVHIPPGAFCISKRIPYCIVAVEAGPLSGVGVRRASRRLFNHAQSVSVRNEESLEYVKKRLKVSVDVDVVPDAALTVDHACLPEQVMEDVKALFSPYRNMVRLGIHHPSGYIGAGDKRVRMREGLIAELKKNPEVLPVVFDDSGDCVSRAAQELSNTIRTEISRDCLVLPFRGIWETVGLIAGLSAVLTTKLHVGIVSYSLGVYCESFASHQKTPRFYQLIERPGQCSFDSAITQEQVREKVQRAIHAGRTGMSIQDDVWKRVKQSAEGGRHAVNQLVSQS